MSSGYFEVLDKEERDPAKLFPSFSMYENMKKGTNIKIDNITKKLGTDANTIKIVKNFLSEKEIEWLLSAWLEKEKNIISNENLNKINILVNEIKQNVIIKGEELFGFSLKEDDSINTPHNETFYILRRHENFVTDIHCDNFGDNKNTTYLWNGYLASLIYLNDNYSGGELYFPEHNLTVKPEKGMLIAFPGNFFNRHGIFPAIGDGRFAMSIFLKFKDFE
jgi:hypothetical protein